MSALVDDWIVDVDADVLEALQYERRAVCAGGCGPMVDDGPEFSGGIEECFNEHHGKKQN